MYNIFPGALLFKIEPDQESLPSIMISTTFFKNLFEKEIDTKDELCSLEKAGDCMKYNLK